MGEIIVYQYPNCSTCRKALKWLDERAQSYRKIDIVTNPPSLTTMRGLQHRSGLPVAKLFNTSGESYRLGKFAERLPKMTHDEALEALAADGKLIKRPIIDNGKQVFFGFSAETQAALAATE